MMKQKVLLTMIVMLSSSIFSNPLYSITTNMLSEIMEYFAEKRTPEQLINDWKFGDARFAYNYDFSNTKYDTAGKYCTIFALCPKSKYRFAVGLFEDYPNVGYIDKRDNPYFFMGKIQDFTITPKQDTPAFIYCDKSSVIYDQFIKFFAINELSYQEIQRNFSDQCWDTRVYNTSCFTNSFADDQFIDIGVIKKNLNVVFRYNQNKCRGILLINPEFKPKISLVIDEKILKEPDLNVSIFNHKFIWVPLHSLKEVSQRRLETYTMMSLDKNNALTKLGMTFKGFVNAPGCLALEVPPTPYNYYISNDQTAIMRSEKEVGIFEQFHSLVLNIENIDTGVPLRLPYNLDVQPYRNKYPEQNILYEHIRHDTRARIIIQPYIASLYEDGKLVRILVCTHETGPTDHGWSLVRQYYCHEKMERYFWPVNKAYYPLEILQKDE